MDYDVCVCRRRESREEVRFVLVEVVGDTLLPRGLGVGRSNRSRTVREETVSGRALHGG